MKRRKNRLWFKKILLLCDVEQISLPLWASLSSYVNDLLNDWIRFIQQISNHLVPGHWPFIKVIPLIRSDGIKSRKKSWRCCTPFTTRHSVRQKPAGTGNFKIHLLGLIRGWKSPIAKISNSKVPRLATPPSFLVPSFRSCPTSGPPCRAARLLSCVRPRVACCGK